MQKLFNVLGAALVFSFVAGTALASEEHGLPWGNFALRMVNAAIFIGIIWYAAGALIKKFVSGRRNSIVQKLNDVERQKKDAEALLADVEKRIAGIEAECDALLAEGRKQAENLKAAILADAEKQAAAIVAQARMTAEQEGKAELVAIRSRLADDIVAAMEKDLSSRLGAAEHQKLIDNSLSKVVLQ